MEALQVLGTVLGILVAAAALWRALGLSELLRDTRRLARLASLQESFLTDWNGDLARPGWPGRPSFPERMTAVEAAVDELRDWQQQQAAKPVQVDVYGPVGSFPAQTRPPSTEG